MTGAALGEWVHVYVKRGRDDKLKLVEYVPEGVGDYRYRIRSVGLRMELEWFDDAIGMWVSQGAYKDRNDIAGELAFRGRV